MKSNINIIKISGLNFFPLSISAHVQYRCKTNVLPISSIRNTEDVQQSCSMKNPRTFWCKILIYVQDTQFRMLYVHNITKYQISDNYIHIDKAQKNFSYVRIRVILSKAYFRQEARCLLQPFCSMELNLKVRNFLLSSIYVTAAICGHMMILVWSMKLICNTTLTEILCSW